MNNKTINTVAGLIIAVGVIFFQSLSTEAPLEQSIQATGLATASQTRPAADTNGRVETLYAQKKSDVIVEFSAQVIKLLADDRQGAKHQKFIVRLDSGHTVLVSHNIDLAKRLNQLKENDRLRIKGEYEWTAKGGVVHWTHHDPRGKHEGGWLEHNGMRYE